LVQENIDPGRPAVVGLGNDVEAPVAVQIGDLGLVKVEAFGNDVPGKVSLAVSEEDVGLGLRVRTVEALLGREIDDSP
jgi:hypothetical protein